MTDKHLLALGLAAAVLLASCSGDGTTESSVGTAEGKDADGSDAAESSTPGSIVCDDDDQIALPTDWPHTLPVPFELSLAEETGPTYTTRGATADPAGIVDGFRVEVFPGGTVELVVEDDFNQNYRTVDPSGTGNLEMFNGDPANEDCWQLRYVFTPAAQAQTDPGGGAEAPPAPQPGQEAGRVTVVFGEGQVELPASVCVGFASGAVDVAASNGSESITFSGPGLGSLSGVFTKASGDQVIVTESATAGFNPNTGELQWVADGVGPTGGGETLVIEALCGADPDTAESAGGASSSSGDAADSDSGG